MTPSPDYDVLEGLASDLDVVREMVGHYAGNDQFDAWRRVEAVARQGGALLIEARTALSRIREGEQS